MSELPAGASLGWALSTRTMTAAGRGLPEALEALRGFLPPGLVLDAPGRALDLGRAEAQLKVSGCPLLAVRAPLVEDAPEPAPNLDAAGAADGARAVELVRATCPLLARHRCRRLLVELGDADLPGAPGVRAALPASEDPGALVAGWRAEQREAREAAADRVVRRLHALGRHHEGLRILILPAADPLSFLDLEAANWILEDLPLNNLHLALDLGVTGLQEALGGAGAAAWLDTLGGAVELVLFADHDGRMRGDLLPGAGLGRWEGLPELLPRSVPWVLRPDPGVPEGFLREAADVLERRGLRPPALDGEGVPP